ncbi:protein of unknown function [Burkholderia multivorans]
MGCGRPSVRRAPPDEMQSTINWFGGRAPRVTIVASHPGSEGNHARMQQIGLAAAARDGSRPARQRGGALAKLA